MHCRDIIGSRHNRDPKVFWHEDSRKWVMVLFEGMGLSIFTSDNLKEWNYESHTLGFGECPELFEIMNAEPPETISVKGGTLFHRSFFSA